MSLPSLVILNFFGAKNHPDGHQNGLVMVGFSKYSEKSPLFMDHGPWKKPWKSTVVGWKCPVWVQSIRSRAPCDFSPRTIYFQLGPYNLEVTLINPKSKTYIDNPEIDSKQVLPYFAGFDRTRLSSILYRLYIIDPNSVRFWV